MRLLLDAMLGGLRSYLRMCGHDAAYALEAGVEADDELLELTRQEDRRLVTGDRRLAARAEDAIRVESRETRPQLAELAAAGIELALPASPERCGACNGRLTRVDSGTETPTEAPDPGRTAVCACRDCGQLFWKGSHWDRVADTLADID